MQSDSEIKAYLANLPETQIIAYTDGSSRGNPGPAGIGVVFVAPGMTREYSESIGHATNNVAELKAIGLALDVMQNYLTNFPDATDYPTTVRILTDSMYSIGCVSKNWVATRNVDLIVSIRKQFFNLQKMVKDCQFTHVRGHVQINGNERADQLATQAARRVVSHSH